MAEGTFALRAPSARQEFLFVLFAGWLAFVSIPLALGQIGISWDALNHHVYLGWIADQARFDRDFMAASYQAYQFPYLYWPVYKLASANVSGATAGAVLATLNAFALPPVWMVARACITGAGWLESFLRAASVVLAFASGLLLSMFDSTSNDFLATIPMLWAIAFALWPSQAGRGRFACIVASGALCGVAVACKLSNGPMAIFVPVIWVWAAQRGERLQAVVAGGLATVAAFLLAYGYWGWQLWREFGNPLYPFYDGAFEMIRHWAGWHR